MASAVGAQLSSLRHRQADGDTVLRDPVIIEVVWAFTSESESGEGNTSRLALSSDWESFAPPSLQSLATEAPPAAVVIAEMMGPLWAGTLRCLAWEFRAF